ncbi:hypothetical protein TUM4641_22550 [Shewanella morhuae]|nr:hypothetical protein TUM4641_22550 [Shewanella morhuae]
MYRAVSSARQCYWLTYEENVLGAKDGIFAVFILVKTVAKAFSQCCYRLNVFAICLLVRPIGAS